MLGEKASKDRAQGRGGRGPQAEDPHGNPLLVFRKDLIEHGHGHGHDHSLPDPLDEAPQGHDLEVRGLAAEHTRHGEDDHAVNIGIPVPDLRPDPSDRGHGDRGADHVGDHHPLDSVGVGIQGGHHLGEGDIHDRGVEQGHEGPDHDDDRGIPLVFDPQVIGLVSDPV